jgi:rRNA maturation RNase YbeY
VSRPREGGRAGPSVTCAGFARAAERAAASGAARRALARLRLARSVSLVAVPPAVSRRLNRRWRRRNRVADVLSFPAASCDPRGPAGEIALCPGVIARGARRRGLSPLAWLRVLAAHGVLHCLGYVHDDPRDASLMAAHQAASLAPRWRRR